LYWMSRDQRAEDNWALLHAQEIAMSKKASLHVCFCLVPKFLDATIRHYDFMLRGLHETAGNLAKLGITFELRFGMAQDEVPKLMRSLGNVHAVVCDMSPLRVPMEWCSTVAAKLRSLKVPLVQVDAHNVVPVWEASDKVEIGARTIRPKINRLLPDFLTEFPALRKHPYSAKSAKPKIFDLQKALAFVKVDRTVPPCELFVPGAAAGLKTLEEFVKERLKIFGADRNNPNKNALSGLSPWIHFGQISAQRCALRVRKAGKKEGAEFTEEVIVRRELADNFCFYNAKYDSLSGAAGWAQETLKKHTKDKRQHVYSRNQLERSETHDALWNAAQRQLVQEGKMHGFLRMYWAKKVLEWTSAPAEALKTAIYLNDRYSIDGRDPNGYVGCMWSICGIHDMGWTERPIFGKIRYMNYEGCKRKFKVEEFEKRYDAAAKMEEAPKKKRRTT